MPLNRSLPPLECCRGTSPSHAANWRPFLNADGSGTVAAIAEAVIGPMPGIVARLQLASFDLCQARIRPGFTHEVPEVERYACAGNCKSSSALSGAAISKPRRVIAERAQLPERSHA